MASLVPLATGSMLVCHSRGLTEIDPRRAATRAFDGDRDEPHRCTGTHGGPPIVVSRQGVFQLIGRDRLISDVPGGYEPIQQMNQTLLALGAGRTRTLLLGKKGVHRRTTAGWSDILPYTPSGKRGRVWYPEHITADGAGRVILFGHRVKAQRWSGRSFAPLDLEGPGCSNSVNGAAMSTDGRLALATSRGICVLDSGGSNPVHVAFDTWGHLSRSVQTVAFTSGGDLIGGKDALVGLWLHGGWIRHEPATGIPLQGIAVVQQDSRGRTWIGEKGVAMLPLPLTRLPTLLSTYRDAMSKPTFGKRTKIIDRERVESLGRVYRVREWARNRGGTAYNAREDGRLHAAIRRMAGAIKLYVHVGDIARQARWMGRAARVVAEGGEPRNARAVLADALAVASKTHAPDVEAELWLFQSELDRALGRVVDAGAAARKARALARETGSASVGFRADLLGGAAAVDAGNFKDARRLLKRAARGFGGQKAGVRHARALRAHGRLEVLSGRVDRAYRLLSRAVQESRSSKDSLGEAEGLSLLAVCATRKGDYRGARGRLREALQRLPSASIGARARVSLAMANVSLDFGDLDAARSSLADAERFGRRVQGGRVAAEIGLAGAGLALASGDLANARKRALAALGRAREVSALLLVLDAHLVLARAGHKPKSNMAAAQQIADNLDAPTLKARTWTRLAALLLDGRGAPAKAVAKAEGLLVAALEILPTSEPDLRARARITLALVREAQGRRKAAADEAMLAVEDLEAVRALVPDGPSAGRFLRERDDIYDDGVRLLVAAGRITQALRVAELARARAFLTHLQSGAATTPATAEEAPATRERARLVAALSRMGAELASIRATIRSTTVIASSALGPATLQRRVLGAEAPVGLVERRSALQRGFERTQADLNALDAGSARRETAAVPDTAALSRTPRPGQVVLAYHLFPERDGGVVFVLRKGKPAAAVRLRIGARRAARLVHALRESLTAENAEAGSTEWRGPSRELFRALVTPVLPRLRGAATTLVIPHRTLHYLPFTALTDDGSRFVGDTAPLATAPSVTSLARLAARQPVSKPSLSALILADPTVDYATVKPLPEARREGATVAAAMKGARLVTGAEATEALVRKLAPSAAVLHIASHGELNPHAPGFSRLLLAEGQGSDGALTLREARRLALPGTLVVLSACETALVAGAAGAQSGGDELVGLTRAFLEAGASAVVASLWPVSDSATRTLMKTFYKALAGGKSPAAALNAAQRRLRGSRPHPWYWAAFVVSGSSVP